MKKYMPTTYVDEDGVIWQKNELKKWNYERISSKQIKLPGWHPDEEKIHTIVKIKIKGPIAQQGRLF